jgi:hypothetical protein
VAHVLRCLLADLDLADCLNTADIARDLLMPLSEP